MEEKEIIEDLSEMTNKEIDFYIDDIVEKITGKQIFIRNKIEEIERQEILLKEMYEKYRKAIVELKNRGQINFNIEDEK